MVKVGDRFKHFDDEFEVIGIVHLTGDFNIRNTKNGDEGFMPKRIYYQTQYEQQKQRADAAEKRADVAEEKLKAVKDETFKMYSDFTYDGNLNGIEITDKLLAYIENLERGEE